MNIIDKIVRDWGYEVPNGIIDMQNSYHVVLLEGVLDKYNLTRNQKTTLLNSLRGLKEGDRPYKAYHKTSKEIVGFGSKERRDAAIKAGTHDSVDSKKSDDSKDTGGSDEKSKSDIAADPFSIDEPEGKDDPPSQDDTQKVEPKELSSSEYLQFVSNPAAIKQKAKELGWPSEDEYIEHIADNGRRSVHDKPGRKAEARTSYNENFDTYEPIRDILIEKGYGEQIEVIDYEADKIKELDDEGKPTGEMVYPTVRMTEAVLKRYSNEIMKIIERIPSKEKFKFIDYLKNPEQQAQFPQDGSGNLIDVLSKRGVPEVIIKKIMMHTTQDDQKKGVGMGEFLLAMVCKNVSNSSGAGDLAIDGREFEVKGHNATLGEKPDHYKLNYDTLKQLGVVVVKRVNPNGKASFKINYEGKDIGQSEMPRVMAEHYKNLGDDPQAKAQFEEIFFNMMNEDVFKHPKDMNKKNPEAWRDMAEAFRSSEILKPDFSNPESIQDTISLLNYVNYVGIHGFNDFISHDTGAEKIHKTDGRNYKKGDKTSDSPPNHGNYVYLKGTPIEQAEQLKKHLRNPENCEKFGNRVGFQKAGFHLMRTRIGFYKCPK